MRVNTVKQALKEGRTQLGCSCFQLRSPDAVRALAAAGLDWVFFDAEHGAFGLETLQDSNARGGLRRGCARLCGSPTCRTRCRSPGCSIACAKGVLLPRVESPELLEKAVSCTCFPPMGTRGYGLAAPQLDYEPISIPDAIAHVNDNVLVVLQIETRTALERIDELLSVPNIDAVLIGSGGPADFPRRAGRARSSAVCRGRRNDPRSLRSRRYRAGHAPAVARHREAVAEAGAGVWSVKTATSGSCSTRPPRPPRRSEGVIADRRPSRGVGHG